MAREFPARRHVAWSLLTLSTLTLPHPARAAPGLSRLEAAPQAPGRAQTADGQVRASTRLLFSGDVGAIFFPVNPALGGVFESVMRRAGELLAGSANVVHRRQAEGWRVLRQHEPGRDGGAVYLLLLDPAVRDADYSLRAILELAEAEESGRLQADFSRALASTPVQADYDVLISMARSGPAEASTAGLTPAGETGAEPPAVPPAQRRIFTGTIGLLFNFIKPDKSADFEAVMTRLQGAIARSSSPVRRRQAMGWRVLRQTGNEPAGESLYLFLIDPVEKDADYSPARLLGETLGSEESAGLIKLYMPAFSRGVSLLNFSVIASAGRQ